MDNKNSGESKALNTTNAKSIEIYAELCAEWGFSTARDQVVSVLIAALNKNGYDVKFNIIAKKGGQGEFFVYQVINGKKQILFSNESDHSKDGAIIGYDIDSGNVDSIVGKIVA